MGRRREQVYPQHRLAGALLSGVVRFKQLFSAPLAQVCLQGGWRNHVNSDVFCAAV